jgi:hypothetical protein
VKARLAVLTIAALAAALSACGHAKKLASPREGMITTIVSDPSFDRVSSLAIGPDGSIYVGGRGGANVYPVEGEGRPLYRTPHDFMEIRGIALVKDLVYLSDSDDNTVKAITRTGGVINVAGNGEFALPDEGVQAALSPLACPGALFYDEKDSELRIRTGVDVHRIDDHGIVRKGFGLMGQTPEEKCKASFTGLIHDNEGNEYVARKTFVIQNAADRTYPEGGPSASPPAFEEIAGIAYNPRSNSIYVADKTWIKRIALPAGTITTVAGTGSDKASETDGKPLETDLGEVQAIAVDRNGNVYFAAGFPPIIRALGEPSGK